MQANRITPQTFRTIIAAAVIGLALHLSQSQDILRDFTRPLVLGTLHGLGIMAVDQGEMITIGKLEVPWTRDCAGVNLLLIMLALAVWVNRQEKIGLHFWIRVGLMIPASLAANIARVLTLITYRAVFYPALESPQTHYFMGLVWLAPFVSLITPKSHRPASHSLMETLHAAAVVALLAPLSGAPNGSLIMICAVIALSQCRLCSDHRHLRLVLTLLWIVGGVGIALSNMESFWLPWLLLCPLLVNMTWLTRLSGIIVIACTHSMFAMQPWAMALGCVGMGMSLLTALRNPDLSEKEIDTTFTPPIFVQNAITYACLVCFALPFTASTFLSYGQVKWTPPTFLESRSIGNDGYELRLPDQSPNLGLVCYSASGGDRHHTVKVCLKFRGVDIDSISEDSPILSDCRHWLREFFLQDSALHLDYSAYLRSTFRPWASPGVHLIFVAPKESMTPKEFEAQTIRLAEQLHTICGSIASSDAHLTVASQP